LIQRRRWANGGLIILPKLLRYLARGQARFGEGFMRLHYLVSIAAVNFGLLLLLAVPFTESLTSLWLPLTAASYFLLYARDLKLVGYRVSDLFRVYALNLLMIPVNLGGVLKSMQQAWTKEKIPFGRTPKVAGRTSTAPLYVIAVYAMLISWLGAAGLDLAEGLWAHGLFAAINAGFLLYAVIRFVGLRESREDLAACLRAPKSSQILPESQATASVRLFSTDLATVHARESTNSFNPSHVYKLQHQSVWKNSTLRSLEMEREIARLASEASPHLLPGGARVLRTL